LKILRLLVLSTLILLTSGSGQSFAQRLAILNMPTYDKEMFHFGFVLGANQCNFTVKPIPNLGSRVWDSTYIPDILPMPDSARVLGISSNPALGFVISIVTNMRLGDYCDLRFIPSLTFGDRDLLYNVETYRFGDTTFFSLTKKIPSTYINFPLEVRYKSDRYNNFRAYAMAGFQYTLDLASQAKKREQRNSDEKIVKINASDLYAEGGIGFEFYNEWFKFGVELKMMYGLMDVIKREHNLYTDSEESIIKVF
jgi:hypothetical protein